MSPYDRDVAPLVRCDCCGCAAGRGFDAGEFVLCFQCYMRQMLEPPHGETDSED